MVSIRRIAFFSGDGNSTLFCDLGSMQTSSDGDTSVVKDGVVNERTSSFGNLDRLVADIELKVVISGAPC